MPLFLLSSAPLFVPEERSDNGKDERKETKGWVVTTPLLLLSIPFRLGCCGIRRSIRPLFFFVIFLFHFLPLVLYVPLIKTS